jgi:integrase
MGLKRIGPNTWKYDVHVDGVAERPRGIFEGKRFEAEAFYAAKKTELRTGSLTFRTVGEIFARYKADHYHKTARYLKTPKQFESIMAGIGHYDLKEFKESHWRSWLERKEAEGYKAGKSKKRRSYSFGTLDLFTITAKSAFQWAVDHCGYTSNPLKNFPLYDKDNRKYWTYSPKNYDDLIREATGHQYEMFFRACRAWPHRSGEFMVLSGADLLDTGIKVEDPNTKEGEGGILPFPKSDPRLSEYLKAIPRSCPHLFCTAAGHSLIKRAPMNGNNLRRWLRSKQAKLQLPGAQLHGFRRSGVVHMIRGGASIPAAMKAGSWSPKSIEMFLDRYVRLTTEDVADAMDKAEKYRQAGQILDKSGAKSEAA